MEKKSPINYIEEVEFRNIVTGYNGGERGSTKPSLRLPGRGFPKLPSPSSLPQHSV